MIICIYLREYIHYFFIIFLASTCINVLVNYHKLNAIKFATVRQLLHNLTTECKRIETCALLYVNSQCALSCHVIRGIFSGESWVYSLSFIVSSICIAWVGRYVYNIHARDVKMKRESVLASCYNGSQVVSLLFNILYIYNLTYI